MSKSVNQVTLLGNLTKDPELKYTPQGTAVINFGIATNRSYKDKTTDEWKEIPEFTNVVFWGKSAEIISQYCKKGNKLYVQGRLQTRSWDDQQSGTKRYATEVIGSDFTLLTPRPPQEQEVAEEQQEATNEQADEIFSPKPAPEPLVPDKVVEDDMGEGFEKWMEEEEVKKAEENNDEQPF